jgi:hypothetical protein
MPDDEISPPQERGRPSIYSEETAAKICQQLADGMTLREICRAEDMPAESTVRLWSVEDREGFSARYTRAREAGYQYMADELVEISDDGSNDWIERNDEDNKGYEANGEHLQRSRLRVDTRKWLLSKALPKIYGDRLIHAGDADNPVVTKETGFDRESARRLAFALTEAARGSGSDSKEGD